MTTSTTMTTAPTSSPIRLTLGLAALTLASTLAACDTNDAVLDSDDADDSSEELRAFGDGPQQPLSASPNVLLIIIDDMGIDKAEPYLPELAALPDPYVPANLPSMPTLQELSDSGLRFTNAWANPACSPTRAATYTGRHGFRTGVGTPGNTLSTSETILADVLHQNTDTYEVGLFGKWHLGDKGLVSEPDILAGLVSLPVTGAGDLHPIAHGYDKFAGELDGSVDSYWGWVRSVADQNGWESDVSTTYTTEQGAEDLVDWVSGTSGPWFATMAFQAPHSLQNPNPTGNGDNWGYFEAPGPTSLSECFPTTNLPGGGQIWDQFSDAKKYEHNAECLDLYMGHMLEELEFLGELDNTLIIVVGDNGTEHTFEESIFAASPEAKASPYEDGVHVPLIVADGGAWADYVAGNSPTDGLVASPGRDVTGLVHVVDLFATIADVAGASQTTGTDSESFAAVLDDPNASAPRLFNYAEQFSGATGSAAIRTSTFKLIVHKTKTSNNQTAWSGELYQIGANLRETGTDLLTVSPRPPFVSSMCQTLWTQMEDLHQSEGSTWLSGAPNPC